MCNLDVGAQAFGLGPAGEAGLDLVAQQGSLDERAGLLVVGDGVGVRADDAHAALRRTGGGAAQCRLS